jgi:hypothetical protein
VEPSLHSDRCDGLYQENCAIVRFLIAKMGLQGDDDNIVADKMVDVGLLYLTPTESPLLRSTDEKTQIKALSPNRC